MKKITPVLLSILIAAMLFSSCKKDSKTPLKTNNGAPFYIKLKLNGVQKAYTFNATSLISKPNVYACALTALASSSNTAGITIGLTDGATFVAGKTYTQDVITVNNITTVQGSMTFKTEEGPIYFCSGTVPNTTFSLTFSEVAADHLKGTFSAKMVQSDKSPATYVTITDGEFNVGRSL